MDKKAENLKKLSKTGVIMDFIKKNNGSWDHQGWLDFCKYLEEKGYTPIDFDQVGALLEVKKGAYLISVDLKNVKSAVKTTAKDISSAVKTKVKVLRTNLSLVNDVLDKAADKIADKETKSVCDDLKNVKSAVKTTAKDISSAVKTKVKVWHTKKRDDLI